MNVLLGLNKDLLQQVSQVERSSYISASWLFLFVASLSFISNGYFGFLFLGTWWGAILLSLLVGFIHFSVLRISLITLMTKPLIDKEESAAVETLPLSVHEGQEQAALDGKIVEQKITAEPTSNRSTVRERVRKMVNNTKLQAGLKRIRKSNFSSVMRFVFVGLIAMTICIPMSTLFFHNEAMQIEESYRSKLIQSYELAAAKMQISSGPVDDELKNAHYPFVIFEALWHRTSYRLLVIIFLVIVYTPLFALGRLRHGKGNRYADLCRESMRKEILIDYQETMDQSQYHLEKTYPFFKDKLMDLVPFSDPPFKYKAKNLYKRKFGNSAEFRNFMREM